jgi:hypothetical protein
MQRWAVTVTLGSVVMDTGREASQAPSPPRWVKKNEHLREGNIRNINAKNYV